MDPAEILRRAWYELKQKLDPGDVLDYLFIVGVFSQAEFDRCRELDNRSDQCVELLSILTDKGENGFKHFCIILEKNQRHLKNIIDEITTAAGASEYVYIKEADLNKVIAEKDAIISKQEQKLSNLEEKFEAYTLLTQEDNTDRSPEDTVPACNVESGRCILETSAECNTQKLLLLSCLHNVCQSCIEQQTHNNFVCKCGKNITIKEEKLPIDYVLQNEVKENAKCGNQKTPCRKDAVSHCTDCSVSLCVDCQQGTHDCHKVAALDELYEEKKEAIRNVLQQQEACLEEIHQCLNRKKVQLDTLKKQQDKTEKDLVASHENITVKYLTRTKALLQKVRDEYAKVQKDVQTDIGSLFQTEASLTRIIDYTNSSIAFTSRAEFLEMSEFLISMATRDQKHSAMPINVQNKHVVVSYHGQKALVDMMEMFGDVSCKDTPEAEDDVIPTLSDVQLDCNRKEREKARLVADVSRLQQLNGLMMKLAEGKVVHFLDPRRIKKSFVLTCPLLIYDQDKVNQVYAYINADGELENKRELRTIFAAYGPQKYEGTCSTTFPLSLTGYPQYWETLSRVCVKSILTGNLLVLEMALSREKEHYHTSPHSYSMIVTNRMNDKETCLEILNQGKRVQSLPGAMANTAGTEVNLHYGMLYDDVRKKVAFMNIKEMKIISVLDIVDTCSPLWPMFGVYNPRLVNVRMKLLSSQAVEMTKEKKSMILEALG